MNDSNGIKSALLEVLADLLPPNGLTPFDLQRDGILAAALRDIQPLIGKRAAHAVENLTRTDQITDGPLHDSPRGGCGKKDGLTRLK